MSDLEEFKKSYEWVEIRLNEKNYKELKKDFKKQAKSKSVN